MNTSLYFHIPFCRRRCGYCDFVTFAGFESLIPVYFEALRKQVAQIGRGQTVHTIYFGGGTPSLIPPGLYKEIFSAISENFTIENTCEITLEANPGSVTSINLGQFREIGFNRISFGMQSARTEELSILERDHSFADVEKAVWKARSAGFSNINLDLIFGLPLQTVENWEYSIKSALSLDPEHLSLYSLILEEETPLFNQIKNGVVQTPDEDTAADQFKFACDFLSKLGFDHYEISNWARVSATNNFQCKHNLQYWRLGPYLGFGAGAVGFVPSNSIYNSKPMLMKNPELITKYIQMVNSIRNNGASDYLSEVSTDFEKETRIFVGFRLLHEGINLNDFEKRFNSKFVDEFGERLFPLIEKGLIVKTNKPGYRLSKKGWLLANQVFRAFSTIIE